MPSFMSEERYNELSEVRRRIATVITDDPSGVFVPWAGNELEKRGGIYYVGQAVDRGFGAQDYDAGIKCTASMCDAVNHGEKSPFWHYLDKLTRALLGGRYWETSARWGWSNILKIAVVEGKPTEWPEALSRTQSDACIRCLREELAYLQNSLVAIVAGNDFGIFREAMAGTEWNKELENDGIWWTRNAKHGVLYVWGYHPNYCQQDRFRDRQLARTVELADKYLDWAKH